MAPHASPIKKPEYLKNEKQLELRWHFSPLKEPKYL
jgi:hypothetical protein